MVSANPASAFDLDIYRTGYYGGTGGGGWSAAIRGCRAQHNQTRLLEKIFCANANGRRP